MIVGTEVPTFVRGLTAVVEDLHVDDGVGGDGGPPPPAPPLAVVVPLPQLPRPRRRRRRLLTARVRRPSGRVQVQGAVFQVTAVTVHPGVPTLFKVIFLVFRAG